MGCTYPDFKASTAYSKGCRCARCKEYKREIGKASASKPWDERHPSAKARYPVPADPILRVIEKWLKEKGCEYTDPYQGLATALGAKPNTIMRLMSRLRRRETAYMGFNYADKVVTALFGVHYWYENEELLKIYEECA